MSAIHKSSPKHQTRDEQTIQIERIVLRTLCTGTPQGPVRESAERLLGGYSWREPVHRAIFEALLSIPSDLPEDIRSRLPARLTLKGYPDVDFEDLFQPHSLSKEKAERLFQSLRNS